MKSLENNKNVVYAIVLFAVAIIAYNYLLKSSQEASLTGISAQNIGNDVVELNRSLQAVTLDQTLFSSAEFKSLTDWSPNLSPQPQGRTNPFAPLGQ
jgi:hypothetical protein